jgi:hypothetical protein
LDLVDQDRRVETGHEASGILQCGLARRAVVERQRAHRMIGCGDLGAQSRLADLGVDMILPGWP